MTRLPVTNALAKRSSFLASWWNRSEPNEPMIAAQLLEMGLWGAYLYAPPCLQMLEHLVH